MPDYGLPIYDQSADFTPPDPAEELRRRQEASLQEHQAYAANLQSKQQEVDLRGEDLRLAQLSLQALSPDVPGSARKFLLSGLSQASGVDPKGDYSRQLQTMLAGLDPQSMEAVRRTFAEQLNAAPGQIKQALNGIFTGKVPASSLIQKVAETQRSMVGSQGTNTLGGGQGEDTLQGGGVQPLEGTTVTQPKEFDRFSQTPTVQPDAARPDLSPMAAAKVTPEEIARSGQILRRPTQGETAPRDQPVDPAFLDVLGYPSTVRARNQDILKDYPRAPTTPKEQQDLTNNISEQATNAVSGVLGATRLHSLFMGRPETLGIVGATVRTVDEVIDQIKAAADLAGGASKELDLEAPGFRKMLLTAADKIHSFYKDTNMADTAVDSARIQSQILQMAYDMAIARGIPGNRLTNSIIGQQLTTLGKSASEAQFQGVLTDITKRSLEEGALKIGTRLGNREFYPSLSNMPDSNFDELVSYMEKAGDKSVVPLRFKQALEQEATRRADVAQGGTGDVGRKPLTLSTPTIEQENKAFQEERSRQVLQEETKIAQGQQRLQMEQTAEERKNATELKKVDIENRRQLENDRRYQLQVQKEERAAAHQRQQQIIQAFSHLGASIAGSIKGGGGGLISDAGGGQDSSAFQIRPPAQRSAPRPVDASAYQRKR